MFSLIIAIIAIALVVALAAATLFYGGDSFTDNSQRTTAAKFQNEATQIVSAITYFRTQNGGIPSGFAIQDLVPEYLATLPPGNWHVDGNRVIRTGVSDGVCLAANTTAGFLFNPADPDVEAYAQDPSKGIPTCANATLNAGVPCCLTP